VFTRLSEIQPEQEAECFAVLAKKVASRTKKDEPYLQCQFRDRRVARDAMLWQDSRFFRQAQGWVEGEAFRLKVRGTLHPKFGMQITLLDIRPVRDDDREDGYDLNDLVVATRFEVDHLWSRIQEQIEKGVDDPCIKTLLKNMLETHRESFQRLQAATSMHHAYTGGLLEHVWSMLRVSAFLADHYSRYYSDLDPPINRSIIIAATILHDIGKLRELEYAPVEARYTTEGCLLGHVVMGRDMVREAAGKIEGFPPETLLLLEHAILAHHGKREFGAPVLPQTIEAYIVSAIDELDAKVNAVAQSILAAERDDSFSGKVYPLENRRFYRGSRGTACDGTVRDCNPSDAAPLDEASPLEGD
jgi:3'-5' exoribonuclease